MPSAKTARTQAVIIQLIPMPPTRRTGPWASVWGTSRPCWRTNNGLLLFLLWQMWYSEYVKYFPITRHTPGYHHHLFPHHQVHQGDTLQVTSSKPARRQMENLIQLSILVHFSDPVNLVLLTKKVRFQSTSSQSGGWKVFIDFCRLVMHNTQLLYWNTKRDLHVLYKPFFIFSVAWKLCHGPSLG